MKTLSLLIASALCAAAALPVQVGKHLKLPDGQTCLAEELRLVLKDDFADQLSTQNGRARAVNASDLAKLDPAILRIEARHVSARNWLKGDPLPAHLKRQGKVPKIARTVTVVLKPGTDPVAAAAALRKLPQVQLAALKMVYDLNALPNDPSYSNQWGMHRIGIPDGDWDIAGKGTIRVAIVDSGVDYDHPDFGARVVYSNGYADFTYGHPPSDRGHGFDHGTHVAGIVGAIRNNYTGVAGVSNNISLMAMNCATWNSDKNIYGITNGDDAIDDAVGNGARVINCSWGPPRVDGRVDLDSAVNDAIDNAYNNNVLVVVSAGNEAMDIADHYWAQSAVPLIVSAAKKANPATAQEVFDNDPSQSNSNFGSRIDLCAPGGNVYSTVPTGGPPGSVPYGNMSGTSMAAPHVAGAAAHLMSMNPGLIEDHSAKHLLLRMSQDAGPVGKDDHYGWGLLRLRREHLQVLRDADAFVGNTDFTGADIGTYDQPYADIAAGVAGVPNGGTVVLNGGDVGTAEFHYPPITITKPCVLKALPDSHVIIGQ